MRIRRCAWCAVDLRPWQWRHCRQCRRALLGDAGLYLRGGGPPFPFGSRRNQKQPSRRETR